MLIAFLLYNDGIGTIIRMAAAFGTEIGLESGALIAAILLVQFSGSRFVSCSGRWREGRRQAGGAGRIGGVHGHRDPRLLHPDGGPLFHPRVPGRHGAGGTQALPPLPVRLARAAPPLGEFFAFFRWLTSSPASSAGCVRRHHRRDRLLSPAVLSVIAFFAVGALLLLLVDVGAGQREARAAEAARRCLAGCLTEVLQADGATNRPTSVRKAPRRSMLKQIIGSGFVTG